MHKDDEVIHNAMENIFNFILCHNLQNCDINLKTYDLFLGQQFMKYITKAISLTMHFQLHQHTDINWFYSCWYKYLYGLIWSIFNFTVRSNRVLSELPVAPNKKKKENLQNIKEGSCNPLEQGLMAICTRFSFETLKTIFTRAWMFREP